MNIINRTAINLLVLLLAFTGCTNKGSEKRDDRDYTSAELIGKWNSVVSDDLLQNKDVEIVCIHLVNDSVAEVQIIDSTGTRKVVGTWKTNYEKELGITSLTIKSDIIVDYSKTEHDMQALLFTLTEEDGTLYMDAGGYKFQKE